MRIKVFILVCFLTASTHARIITVDDNEPADFNTIQAAINDSNDGDIVEVQPGIYTGEGNRDIDFGGRAITVRSTNPNDTNIVAATIIDCNGTWLDKHRGFHFHNGEDNNSVLKGLTIKNGYAWDEFDDNDVLEDGGGILFENSSPTIRNCIISNSFAGYSGAVGVHGGFGGGICCYNNGNAIISNCIIISNIADRGGAGIACCESSPTISSCIVSAGSSPDGGGGIYCGNNSNPLITNCTIVDNYTQVYGGGIWCCSNSDPSILDCAIKANSAGDGSYGNGLGGGIACTESAPTIRNCVITGNYASVSGGGIHCDADINPSNPSIINCTIAHNHAGDEGGGIRCYFSDPIITNSIVWGNTTDSLGSQIALLLNPLWPSTLTVLYCDIQGGQTDAYVADGCSLKWLTGNIDADPCFVKPGYWVFDYNIPDHLNNRFWVDGDYHLKSMAGRWEPNSESWVQDDVMSPCIDAGNPMSPIGLEPFPNGGRINMGAYGGTAEASKSYFGQPVCETIVAGDINGDCIVNFKDFALMAFHWLRDENQ